MNTIDFIRECAAQLVRDRPDIYDQAAAVDEISTAIDELRVPSAGVFTCVSFTSYLLARIDHGESTEEFILSRKIGGLILSESEEDVMAFSYPDGVDGLPDIFQDDEEEDDES